ncbi:hypothetical protein [Sutcliffiella deserti]|uniref:hypothetical protein n=1 Tax=Sutcliffiella deserti TaxID=2875501 RepID=UPI001CBB91D3|nr:hypothetical protein [Sutcliffiella deserti]
MNEKEYFDGVNYTGDHLHVANWEEEVAPAIESIAWVRQDGSMDLFFNDFLDEKEIRVLFESKDYYYDERLGVFLSNVKTDDEAYEVFFDWVEKVLYPYRNKGK